MANKTYKAIFVPAELHYEIKKLALKKKLTIIDFLKETLNYNKGKELIG